jgi:peptidoglycan/LPS O-acetylase OafA/YrhL
VLWSLSCEAFFYLAFPLVYRRMSGRDAISRLKLAAAVVVPTSFVACVASFAGSRYDLAAFAFPGLRIGEFVLGVALGMAARDGVRATRRQRRWLAMFAYAWLVVPLIVGYYQGHRQGLVDTIAFPALAIIIFLLGTREADGDRVPVVSTRLMTYFGEVSYSFYLVHPVALSTAIQLGWFETSSSFDAVVAFAGSFALSLALASLLHHVVENNARVWLLGLARKPPNGGNGPRLPKARSAPEADVGTAPARTTGPDAVEPRECSARPGLGTALGSRCAQPNSPR